MTKDQSTTECFLQRVGSIATTEHLAVSATCSPLQQEHGGPLGLPNAQTFAIQAQSLKSISAGVLMLLCSEPTRHGLLPNTSGNEVLQPGLVAEGN